jgi:voltage-gated potassium channel
MISILIGAVAIFFTVAAVIMVQENTTFGQAVIEIFPAFFGELGTIGSPSLPVRACIIIGMIASVTVIAVVTAKITSVLVEAIRRGGIMARKVNLSGHTIICGWNFQGELMVKELLKADVKEQRGIVILHDSEERPIKDERVEFVRGDPSQDDDLKRAGIMKADSIIVLTDCHKGANEADAEALMVTLAVESMNRKVHTCVQIMNSANRMHLERAHADEIICLDQLGGSLMVASALNHGVSNVVSELLTFDIGSEFYRYDGHISDKLVGKEFAEAVQILARRRTILIAIETNYSEDSLRELSSDVVYKLPEKDRAIVVNPQSGYKMKQGDTLFVIAESEPAEL